MHQYHNISIEQAQQLLDAGSCTVFDIRDERSYEQGRLPGAERFNEQIIRRMRKTEQRNAPVLIYCYHGISSRDIAQMLCDFGFPDVYSMDGGYTAWEAAQNKESPITSETHSWLEQQGTSANTINARLEYGMTALMQACRYGLANIAKNLLQIGADIHLINEDGNNALWLACFSGNAEIIDKLLEHGIDIDHQNFTGATALMYASSAGKHAIVRQLLSAGANPRLTSQDEYTALDLASTPQVYKLLRQI